MHSHTLTHTLPLLARLQFGGQEPGEAADISSFATERYAATFPLMAKVDVNGEHQHPVFAWLKANAPAPPGGALGMLAALLARRRAAGWGAACGAACWGWRGCSLRWAALRRPAAGACAVRLDSGWAGEQQQGPGFRIGEAAGAGRRVPSLPAPLPPPTPPAGAALCPLALQGGSRAGTWPGTSRSFWWTRAAAPSSDTAQARSSKKPTLISIILLFFLLPHRHRHPRCHPPCRHERARAGDRHLQRAAQRHTP